MRLAQAKTIAEEIVSTIEPYCERVLIAGSIRRGKADVKDIEIVAVPTWSFAVPAQLKTPSTLKKQEKIYSSDYAFERIPSNYELFGNADNEKSDIPKGGAKHNLLFLWGNRQSLVLWIKPGVSEPVTWDIKPDGKYWRGVIESEDHAPVKLDLFLTTPEQWGVITTIRTGPAEFSSAIVTAIKKYGLKVDKGQLWNAEGESLPCAEEEDFFKNCGFEFVPVEMRGAADPYSLLKRKGDSNA